MAIVASASNVIMLVLPNGGKQPIAVHTIDVYMKV